MASLSKWQGQEFGGAMAARVLFFHVSSLEPFTAALGAEMPTILAMSGDMCVVMITDLAIKELAGDLFLPQETE